MDERCEAAHCADFNIGRGRSLDAGTLVGRYRIASLLGAGGMGEVYLARDESLDRPVALKVLPPDLVANEERVRRSVQEAKSASLSGTFAYTGDGAHLLFFRTERAPRRGAAVPELPVEGAFRIAASDRTQA